MKFRKILIVILLSQFLMPTLTFGQPINVQKIKKIRLKMFPVEGLIWKNESTQNTNWNKITETPDGKIWFCGGDHWGTDGITGMWDKSERYERPWGFGNTSICFYDPRQDKVFYELELDRASSIYSNAETPGHGKIHGNIASDSRGFLYFAGYMGASYMHESTRAYYPKSYAGGAIIKYDPATKNIDYYGIPVQYGPVVGLYYDEKRNTVYGINSDRAKFWRVNLSTMELNRYESLARMSRLENRVREMIMDNNGFCYFANDIGGLTKYDPDTEKFIDIDVKLPGKIMDFRASVVSSDNIIYCITTDGFVWSFNPQTNTLGDLGHVLNMPDQPHYTPNIALDEKWGRLYFMAGNHGGGFLEEALGMLTILDLKTKKYYWIGSVEGIEGCFGAICSKSHSVYFSCFGDYYRCDEIETDKNGGKVTRPYLIRYDPPQNLNTLK